MEIKGKKPLKKGKEKIMEKYLQKKRKNEKDAQKNILYKLIIRQTK